MSVVFTTQEALCQYSTEQTVLTSIPSSVAIEKKASNTEGSIRPETGAINGTLSSEYELSINDNTENYSFAVYSTMNTTSGEVSAFAQRNQLMFGNLSNPPLAEDVEKARKNEQGNADVIVYPFTLSYSNQENIKEEYISVQSYGNLYKITFLNGLLTGTLTQTITGDPIANTYSTEDTPGTYAATVYITVIQNE